LVIYSNQSSNLPAFQTVLPNLATKGKPNDRLNHNSRIFHHPILAIGPPGSGAVDFVARFAP
jgi:hypothetical protein